MTDHRIGLSVVGVDRVMSGLQLETLHEALIEADKKHKLEAFLARLESDGDTGVRPTKGKAKKSSE